MRTIHKILIAASLLAAGVAYYLAPVNTDVPSPSRPPIDPVENPGVKLMRRAKA